MTTCAVDAISETTNTLRRMECSRQRRAITALLVLTAVLVAAGCSGRDDKESAALSPPRPYTADEIRQAFRHHDLALYEFPPERPGVRSFTTANPRRANFAVEVFSTVDATRATEGLVYVLDEQGHVENIVDRRVGNVRVIYDRKLALVHARVEATSASLVKR